MFFVILPELTKEQIHLLQNKKLHVVVKNKLHSFYLEKTKELETIDLQIIKLENFIIHLETHISEINELMDAVNSLSKNIELEILRVNQALAIAWNLDAIDLIDSLSFLKETWQKYQFSIVGHPKSEIKEATGLYAKIEKMLKAVYENNL